MNVFKISVTVTFCLFQFSHCSNTSSYDLENQGEITELVYIEVGCITTDSIVVAGDSNVLSNWNYENEILELEFLFDCNCCTEFDSQVSSKGSIVSIKLIDIAEDHCRCTCKFQTKFSFIVKGTNRVKIVLYVERYPDYELLKLVDQELTL